MSVIILSPLNCATFRRLKIRQSPWFSAAIHPLGYRLAAVPDFANGLVVPSGPPHPTIGLEHLRTRGVSSASARQEERVGGRRSLRKHRRFPVGRVPRSSASVADKVPSGATYGSERGNRAQNGRPRAAASHRRRKHCFSIDELDRHRKVSDGDLAARVFEMFNADRTQVEAVIALREAPERIRQLFQDWLEMSDCVIAGPPGIGGRRLQRLLKPRLTRHLVWTCLNIVLSDPQLRAKAERAIGQSFG